MEEIKLKLRHDLPFNNISRDFPGAKIFRWCNSYVDYLEFAERGLDKNGVREEVERFAEGIGSRIVFSSEKKDYLTLMIVCKCSLGNSTLRMAVIYIKCENTLNKQFSCLKFQKLLF